MTQLKDLILLIHIQYPEIYKHILYFYTSSFRGDLTNDQILVLYAKYIINNTFKDSLTNVLNFDNQYQQDIEIITFKNDEKATRIKIYLTYTQILKMLQQDLSGIKIQHYIDGQKNAD